jgi:DNA (cytosine-5)-methyltransferase 1
MRKIRGIDLFCGAGGSSWGARLAGIKVVAAFDLWQLAGKTFKENFPTARFYCDRLEKLSLKGLDEEIGKIDIILASPECTNHSPAKGNRPRCEQSRSTAFQILRFARKFKPRWIIIENVVSMRRWSRYKELKADLQRLGYNLREQILDASEFGVPQSRRRLFIMCDRERMPEAVRSNVRRKRSARSIVNLNGLYRWSPLRTDNRAAATLERAERGLEEVGQEKPFLIVYYGSDHAGGWQKLSRPLRTITTLDRFAVVKPSARGHLMRMLQVPELQAAMGMDGMKFSHGSRRERIKMIGNAVCPPVMCAVLEQLQAE